MRHHGVRIGIFREISLMSRTRNFVSLLLLAFIFSASHTFGYVLLSETSGTRSLLWEENSKVNFQSCGTLALTINDLEKVPLPQLLSDCKRVSQRQSYSVPEGEYRLSVQSLFATPPSYQGVNALADLAIRVVQEQRDHTNQPESNELFEKLRNIEEWIFEKFGPSSHRVITNENERALLLLLYEAFLPVVYDGKQFWLISNPIRDATQTLDNSCPSGWQLASLDMILNAYSIEFLTLWYTSRPSASGSNNPLITWYRWTETIKEPTAVGYATKEEAMLLKLSRERVLAQLNGSMERKKIPRSNSIGSLKDLVPGLNSFVFVDRSALRQYPYRGLCTRTYFPAQLTLPPAITGKSLEAFAAQWKMSPDTLFRRLAPYSELQPQLVNHLYWKTPISQQEESELSAKINGLLGYELATIEQARENRRIIDEMVAMIARNDQERVAREQREEADRLAEEKAKAEANRRQAALERQQKLVAEKAAKAKEAREKIVEQAQTALNEKADALYEALKYGATQERIRFLLYQMDMAKFQLEQVRAQYQ